MASVSFSRRFGAFFLRHKPRTQGRLTFPEVREYRLPGSQTPFGNPRPVGVQRLVRRLLAYRAFAGAFA